MNLNQRITYRPTKQSMDLKAQVIAMLDAGMKLDMAGQKQAFRLSCKLDQQQPDPLTEEEVKLVRTCFENFDLPGWARIGIECALWPEAQAESDMDNFRNRFATAPMLNVVKAEA